MTHRTEDRAALRLMMRILIGLIIVVVALLATSYVIAGQPAEAPGTFWRGTGDALNTFRLLASVRCG